MRFLFILFGLVSFSALAQDIEVIGSEFFKESVEDVFEILPMSYFDRVKQQVYIREKKFKTDHLITDDLCNQNPKVKFGSTYKNTITISSKLVELAKGNRKLFDCGHGTFQNMLFAVVIHELTHIKDNVEKISTEPDFQRIVGMKRVQRSSKKKISNRNYKTTVDAYEFTNLEESLSVNTEYLFLDPEFECRKPATASYLAEKYNYKLSGKCKKNYKVMLQSSYLEDNYMREISIDPERVYEVHYLFASKGSAVMSKWGHAMLRIVLCAPWREQVGPECLEDVSHHVVISYRAQLTELSINYFKGLVGKYPSQLFMLSFIEVQQEYTKFEFRDLYSVPLKFSKKQIREFINLTLERYWTYKGKYYFINNNCGTETAKHIAYVLPDEHEELIRSLTPLRMFNDIQRNKEELAGDYYIFQSQRDEFSKHYDYVTDYIPELRSKNIKTFLKKTRAFKRAKIYREFFETHTFNSKLEASTFYMKFTYLERYLAAKYLQEFPSKILKKMNKSKELKEEIGHFGESIKSLILNPWDVVETSYGMPLEDEFDESFKTFQVKGRELIKKTIDSQLSDIETILKRPAFTEEIKEIEAFRDIRKIIIKKVREVEF